MTDLTHLHALEHHLFNERRRRDGAATQQERTWRDVLCRQAP